jgi:hypothetical protein
MGDVRLAGVAALARVGLGGEVVGAPDSLDLGRGEVAFDLPEQAGGSDRSDLVGGYGAPRAEVCGGQGDEFLAAIISR